VPRVRGVLRHFHAGSQTFPATISFGPAVKSACRRRPLCGHPLIEDRPTINECTRQSTPADKAGACADVCEQLRTNCADPAARRHGHTSVATALTVARKVLAIGPALTPCGARIGCDFGEE
jgi:hypothetical protein